MAGLALKPERDEAFEKVAVRQVMDTPERVQEALATCHSLAVLQSQLVGDPLDRELFVASGWRLSQVGFACLLGLKPSFNSKNSC